MCHAARCRTCGKTTWRGCGRHVDQVKAQSPVKTSGAPGTPTSRTAES